MPAWSPVSNTTGMMRRAVLEVCQHRMCFQYRWSGGLSWLSQVSCVQIRAYVDPSDILCVGADGSWAGSLGLIARRAAMSSVKSESSCCPRCSTEASMSGVGEVGRVEAPGTTRLPILRVGSLLLLQDDTPLK